MLENASFFVFKPVISTAQGTLPPIEIMTYSIKIRRKLVQKPKKRPWIGEITLQTIILIICVICFIIGFSADKNKKY